MSQTSDPAPRLELRDLTCRFGAKTAVDEVSLTVAAGEVTCLLGNSGCGKSTTLRAVAGVEAAASGQILLDGADITGTPPEARGIGLMFQDFALFPHLSVADNVAYGIKDRRAGRERVATLLARVGLSHYARAYPHELSGGEQQRVALARALAPQPRVMLMDEPFSGLDERLRDAVRDETLQVLREAGTAVLLVTHDPQEAMRMADQIALMRAGRIVQSGAPYTVYNEPVDLAAAQFFSDINIIEGEVHSALVDTAFGPFLAPGHPDGTPVDIVIRPQHVGIDFNRPRQLPHRTASDGQPVRAEVARARFLGQLSVVEFTLADGTALAATVPGLFQPPVGTTLLVRAPRRHCRIFPRSSRARKSS
ncbi:MAG: ABC transporter ATP-binding protein [Pseudomonadota bacterium]